MKTKSDKKVIKITLIIVVIILSITILAISVGFLSIYARADLNDTKIIAPSAKAILKDKDGNEILYNSSFNKYTKYADISPNIINAFVTLEDKRFFRHNGLDYIRIGGAIVNNVRAGYFKEGASTISQQLAKNTQLSNEKTIERKIMEARIARQIENKYTKEEILEMYLNAIYFGNGIYGIEKACKIFFDKDPSQIDLYEAAMLAGIVKSPNNNSPLNNPENANARKNKVLSVLLANEKISKEEYQNALDKNFIKPENIKNEFITTYYANAALNEASHILGITEKSLIENNYTINTFLDPYVQRSIYDNFTRSDFIVKSTDDEIIPYYALILDNFSSGISGYHANFNYDLLNFRRQPGSAIKPILVYAPALEAKTVNPATPMIDEKMVFKGYSPNNYKNIYYGNTDIEEAVKKSINTIAVKVLNDTGLEYSKSKATEMGINFTDNDNSLSLALGGMEYGVTPLEITQAYSTLAKGGMSKNASFIKSIYDETGKLVYHNNNIDKRALSETSAYLMTDMLMKTAQSGTANKIGGYKFELAAKTGTVGYENSDLNSDAWCLSYTSEHTMNVWYGNYTQNKDTRLQKSLTGGSYPALLSKSIYQKLYQEKIPEDFRIPDGIISLEIDLKAREVENELYLASKLTPEEWKKPFLFSLGNAPNKYSTIFNLELPKDFEVKLYKNKPYISFTANPMLKYYIVKEYLDSNIIVEEIIEKDGEVNFIDNDNTQTGLIRYFLIVENEYGSKESIPPQSLLMLKSFSKSRFRFF